MLSKLNEIQLDKLSGYFIDLAKIWFAAGVIGFFISGSSEKLSVANLIGGFSVSLVFLTLGLIMLKTSKKNL